MVERGVAPEIAAMQRALGNPRCRCSGLLGSEERDEAGTFERLRAHRKDLFEPDIRKHHGRIFKRTGDGLFAEFSSVVDAVECAVSLQQGLAKRNANFPADQRIDVRIGINLGEVIVEGKDRLGEGVNIAARLEQLAEPGGIYVSGKVAKEVERKLAFRFEHIGERKVKNISEPIAVYKVKLDAPSLRIAKKQLSPIWVWPAAALSIIAAITIAWFLFAQPPPASATIPSIAVLPFTNMSGDPKLSYYSEGVSEDIITMLARSPDLSVVARNSSFTYKGKPYDVPHIGKDLGVGYVLEGYVRKEADELGIVARLINVKTGKYVWSQRFEKAGTDPWALQDKLTEKIIGSLVGEKGILKQAEYRVAWGKDTVNLEEYDYYLRGHDLFMQFTPKSHEQAALIWREGLSKFPNSALLQVKLGFYYFMRVYNGWSDSAEADFKQANELLKQAVAHPNLSPLERRLTYWLSAYINCQQRNFEQALSAVDTAASLAPYDAFMIGNLSQILIMAGRPKQAIEWADAAASRDKVGWPDYNLYRGWALTVEGKHEESLVALQDADPNGVSAPLLRTINLVQLNKLEEARTELKKVLGMDPTFTQAKWRDMYFYSDPSISERQIADLAKAGLSEK